MIRDSEEFLLLRAHPRLKNFYEIQSKLTHETFLCKLLDTESHSMHLKLLEEYSFFFECSHPNIVKFHGIYERINPINNNFQFFLIYDKMAKNLKEFISEKKAKNCDISRIEMKCFVSNIFEGLSYLERNFHKANNNLKPENILISNETAIFKISDIALKNTRSNAFPRKYIPPNIKKNSDFLYNSYDFYNYDTFNFAVLIMEVGNLRFLHEDENIYQDNEMIKLELGQCIGEKYGVLLKELVEKLLGNQGLALVSFKDCRTLFNEYMVFILSFFVIFFC